MNTTVVNRIKTIIEHYGLSVSSFADAIGVQRSTVSHLLSGRNKPSLDFVLKLVNSYPEVDLYWLLYGKGNFPSMAKEDDTPTLNFPDEVGPTIQNVTEDPMTKKNIPTNKAPSRIVIFYEDGTFESFQAKKK